MFAAEGRVLQGLVYGLLWLQASREGEEIRTRKVQGGKVRPGPKPEIPLDDLQQFLSVSSEAPISAFPSVAEVELGKARWAHGELGHVAGGDAITQSQSSLVLLHLFLRR